MERLEFPAKHYIFMASEDSTIAPIVSAATKILNDLAGEERIRYEIIEGTERLRVSQAVPYETVMVKTTFVGLGGPDSAEKVMELRDAIGQVMSELSSNPQLAEEYGIGSAVS